MCDASTDEWRTEGAMRNTRKLSRWWKDLNCLMLSPQFPRPGPAVEKQDTCSSEEIQGCVGCKNKDPTSVRAAGKHRQRPGTMLRPVPGSGLLQWAQRALQPPSPSRRYQSATSQSIGLDRAVEEETLPNYNAEEFYPVHIGIRC